MVPGPPLPDPFICDHDVIQFAVFGRQNLGAVILVKLYKRYTPLPDISPGFLNSAAETIGMINNNDKIRKKYLVM